MAVLCGRRYPGRAGSVYPQCCDGAATQDNREGLLRLQRTSRCQARRHSHPAHWGIENTSHYAGDVTLGEDRSRIRTKPGVFARLRSFAFNINKANRSGTMSQDRFRAALAGIEALLQFRGVAER